MARIRSSRGFVLIVAVLTLVLAVAVAEMAMRIALSESLATTYEVADQRADYIAEAGLSRTAAYLTEIARLEPDFDKALDPLLDTRCSYPSGAQVSLSGGQTDDNLPRFTDGARSNDPGNWFMKVPFNGGTFYVRIDDNSDDGHEGWTCSSTCASYTPDKRTNYFPAATNNREPGGPLYPGHASATLCPEAASVEINALRDNPVRDRDKTVLVTVIGIYPGTNWNMARARKAYRLLVGPSRGNPGLLVGGNLTTNSGVNVCGATGGVHANGNIAVGSGSCACGEISDSDGNAGSLAQCGSPTPCGDCAPSPPATQNTISIPDINPWDAEYMNFFRGGSQQCYFFFASNGVGYFWDHNRLTASSQSCAGFPTTPGSRVPRPCGNGTYEVTDAPGYDGLEDPWCQCWVPVYYDNNGGTIPTPPNPYFPLRAGATQVPLNAKLLDNNGCGSGKECFGDDEWVPQRTAASKVQNTYNYEALCQNFISNGVKIWHTHSGTAAEIRSGVADTDVPDAMFFMDGANTGLVELNSNITAKMGIVTPMRVRFASNINLKPPTWARNYLVISGSTSNTLSNGSSCEISSNGTLEGLIMCQGKIFLNSNIVLNGNLVSKGDIQMNSNITINLDPSLPTIGELPVRPLVWSDAAF